VGPVHTERLTDPLQVIFQISTMRTGLDFKSEQFEMTSHTNNSLFKVR
jgi:hypothetical protein